MEEAKYYAMSSSQLDELWRFESQLSHLLLGVPLRTCSVGPTPHWGKDMNALSFEALKKAIRQMYVKASLVMECKDTHPYGVGLYALEQSGNSRVISKTISCDLGYIVKAPSIGECPTAHRYLRSPFENNCYLGGPISFANYCPKGNLMISRASGVNALSGMKYHNARVYLKTSFDKMKGKELTWNYNDHATKAAPILHSSKEWFLDACCSSTLNTESAGGSTASTLHPLARDSEAEPSEDEEPKPKKRKFSQTPNAVTRRGGIVWTFKPCTYCGVNLDQDLRENSQKVHYKRHFALKHAKDVAREMYDCLQVPPVNKCDFLKQIDKLAIILNKLKDAGFHVIPACNFFKVNGLVPAGPNATEADRTELFSTFEKVAKQDFKLKQVVYLKGIRVPESYCDLEICDQVTNYDQVEWEKCERPSVKLFSLAQLQLNSEEIAVHNTAKNEKLAMILAYYSTL